VIRANVSTVFCVTLGVTKLAMGVLAFIKATCGAPPVCLQSNVATPSVF
jgi:hypothetical protein